MEIKPVFIQQKAEQSTSSVSSFTTTAMTVTGGNSIVACMSCNVNNTLTASDSQVNSYHTAVTKSASVTSVAIAEATNIKPGSTTFTVTPGAAAFCSISAQEYSGMIYASPEEATNSAGPTNSTAVNPGAVNPSSLGDIYVACWTHDGSGNQSFTPNVSGEGWFLRGNLTNTANQPLGSQDLVSSGSRTGSATLSATANWVAAVATFRAVAPTYYPTPGWPAGRSVIRPRAA